MLQFEKANQTYLEEYQRLHQEVQTLKQSWIDSGYFAQVEEIKYSEPDLFFKLYLSKM